VNRLRNHEHGVGTRKRDECSGVDKPSQASCTAISDADPSSASPFRGNVLFGVRCDPIHWPYCIWRTEEDRTQVPILDLARMLYPASPGSRRFVVISAYADESGTHTGGPHGPSGYTVLAGFWARAEQWASFEGLWPDLMRHYGVSSSHAKDLFPRTPQRQFKGWSPQKRTAFLEDVAKVIGASDIAGWSVEFKNSEYVQNYKGDSGPRKYALLNRYGVTVSAAAAILAHVANLHPNIKNIGPLNLVLADGVTGAGHAVEAFNRIRRTKYPGHDVLGTLTFAAANETPALQASDLFAYCVYQYAQRETAGETAAFKDYGVLLKTLRMDSWRYVINQQTLTRMRLEPFKFELERMQYGARR
jgi:hypothetical protein